MSQAQTIARPAPPSAWEMYRAMVGIGLVCGLLIVAVFQLTKPVIDRNKAEALQQAIFQVLPEARSAETYRLVGEDRFELLLEGETGDKLIYAGYGEQKNLIGFAIEAEGMGYADVIRVLYGYSFAADAIVGFRVLESKETPGLGDKIETDPQFLENFYRLDVSLNDDLSAILNPVVPVKHGQKEQPWEVDCITGATISSKTIANMLGRSSGYWVPIIRQNLDEFGQQDSGLTPEDER